MKLRKQFLKIIFIIVIIVIAFSISLNSTRTYTNIEIFLKDLLLPINKVFIFSTSASAKDQTESYLIQKHINTSLEKENQELKALLELNSTQTEYETINATVISRNSIQWLNTITIDKGTKAGLAEDMAVITTNGLIGKISKITQNSSEVKLLTANDITYKTSVIIRVDGKDYYAILNGYDEQHNLLKVTAVDKNIQVKNGDTVLTSGLGKMPQGLYIGTVISSEVDQYDLSKTVYVKTKQDFSSINYVTILKEKD